MDHELWEILSHAMFDVARAFPKSPRQTHDTHRIVRVYLLADASYDSSKLHDIAMDHGPQPVRLESL